MPPLKFGTEKIKCWWCGKEFHPRKNYPGNSYCSHNCRHAAWESHHEAKDNRTFKWRD